MVVVVGKVDVKVRHTFAPTQVVPEAYSARRHGAVLCQPPAGRGVSIAALDPHHGSALLSSRTTITEEKGMRRAVNRSHSARGCWSKALQGRFCKEG